MILKRELEVLSQYMQELNSVSKHFLINIIQNTYSERISFFLRNFVELIDVSLLDMGNSNYYHKKKFI